jgi:hypothetical protein
MNIKGHGAVIDTNNTVSIRGGNGTYHVTLNDKIVASYSSFSEAMTSALNLETILGIRYE